MILACLSPGAADRPTLLLDTKRLPLNKAKRDLLPFRIKNGRNSFFGTILSKCRSFVRFDPGCMVPLDTDGERALNVFSKAHWPSYIEEIGWSEGRAVIIDNWRILHGRGSARTLDRDRILLRILIG